MISSPVAFSPMNSARPPSTRTGLAGRPSAGRVSAPASSTRKPASISGRTALVTAAGDRPVRRAASCRVRGPCVRTVVKIWEAAGVCAGNVSAGGVEGMAGNLGSLISGVNERAALSFEGHERPSSAL